jgi:predicted MFS family arabinose efflux permease
VGSVAGLLILRARYQRLPTLVVLCSIAVAWGLLTGGLALTTSLAGATVLFACAGFMWAPYSAIEAALMQVQVPAAVQGAVFAMQSSFLYTLAVPLGAMLGGVALAHTTPQAVILASGAGCIVAGVAGFLTLRGLHTSRPAAGCASAPFVLVILRQAQDDMGASSG